MTFNPTTYTPALSDDFPSAADWLLPIVRVAWKAADAPNFKLDAWQEELIRRVLEVYPEGHERAGQLRFRQAVISVGRQNGKSVLGAIFGLFGLLRSPGLTIGVASSREQATIIYDRTMHVIRANPSLAKLFTRLTDTRGIKSKDGGKYEIKAASGAALQGLPISVGVVDELHLLKPELWTSLVNGLGGRDGIVVGITTAGDEGSELLKQLYETGAKAAAGDKTLERFGFFEWCAPEARVPEEDEILLEYLKAANPGLQEGRLDAENILADVRAMPPADIIRYRLNRFIASSNAFINLDAWVACTNPDPEYFPRNLRPVFSIDRTNDWEYASIAVAARDADGITYTEIVASINKPTLLQLVSICEQLSRHNPSAFVLDAYTLKPLAAELNKRGYPVVLQTYADVINSSAWAYARIVQKRIRHKGDPLLTLQLSRTVRKNKGEGYRISRQDSSVEIDAVLATVSAMYATETRQEAPSQVF